MNIKILYLSKNFIPPQNRFLATPLMEMLVLIQETTLETKLSFNNIKYSPNFNYKHEHCLRLWPMRRLHLMRSLDFTVTRFVMK